MVITDSTLIQLSIHCPKLQALSLSHCELITDEGILHLSSSTCGHERLRVLELDNCLLVTDAALEHLENCRGLERLELYDCQQVTRAGIKRMRVGASPSLALPQQLRNTQKSTSRMLRELSRLSFLMSKSMPTLLQSPLHQQWQEVDIDCAGAVSYSDSSSLGQGPHPPGLGPTAAAVNPVAGTPQSSTSSYLATSGKTGDLKCPQYSPQEK
ncbi:hypothetical protein U0070_021662 [Myodes glareolus]|uniref:Uncharacterized protein n=1 Tax=Myodes glareolus TaxID=447135 RepID=A0AAW0IQU5_MYOGA